MSSSHIMSADSWPASSLDSSKGLSPLPMPMPMQAAGAPLSSSINDATSSHYHNVNGQRQPFRRNNSTSSSTTNSAAPRDQNRTQRSGSQSRHYSHGRRSFPPGDRRNFDRKSDGRGDMQPQVGFGMLMGSPSYPPSSAQYMAAPQLGSYGGPTLYPESISLVGNFPPPPPIYFPILYNKILTQVEYYFSADNLSRDKHLRCQMNDEGWVPVRIVAGFKRLAELTDNIQTILEALRSSEVVEIKDEALRRRGDWDKYLLPHEPSSSGHAASLGTQLETMTLSERSGEGE